MKVLGTIRTIVFSLLLMITPVRAGVIVNYNQFTMWLYNYFRAYLCDPIFGETFCGALAIETNSTDTAITDFPEFDEPANNGEDAVRFRDVISSFFKMISELGRDAGQYNAEINQTLTFDKNSRNSQGGGGFFQRVVGVGDDDYNDDDDDGVNITRLREVNTTGLRDVMYSFFDLVTALGDVVDESVEAANSNNETVPSRSSRQSGTDSSSSARMNLVQAFFHRYTDEGESSSNTTEDESFVDMLLDRVFGDETDDELVNETIAFLNNPDTTEEEDETYAQRLFDRIVYGDPEKEGPSGLLDRMFGASSRAGTPGNGNETTGENEGEEEEVDYIRPNDDDDFAKIQDDDYDDYNFNLGEDEYAFNLEGEDGKRRRQRNLRQRTTNNQ